MKTQGQAEKAYKQIKAWIFDGTFRPGRPLQEVILAEMLQMSRTPVREAINRLRNEGLLEFQKNKGALVRQFTKHEIGMAYVYAAAVEGMMCAVIAARADELDFSVIDSCFARMQQALDEKNANAWAAEDSNFHQELRNLCDNTFLTSAVESVYGQIHYTRMLVTRVLLDKNHSTQDHAELLGYIKNKDVVKARECMEKHILRIRQEVMDIQEAILW